MGLYKGYIIMMVGAGIFLVSLIAFIAVTVVFHKKRIH